tara:strand:- start:31582 stop:32961 length:1380 start_codon:yes stop_codon:yes gene_type:complete
MIFDQNFKRLEVIKESVKLEELNINNKSFVGYWMSSNQRVNYNYSLNESLKLAKKLKVQHKIFFIYDAKHYDSLPRHRSFMLNGLKEVNNQLTSLGHQLYFYTYSESLMKSILKNCISLIVDSTYTNRAKKYQKNVLKNLNLNIYSVDNLYLPVKRVSDKQEYSAATLRKKYYKELDNKLHIHKFEISSLLKEVNSLKTENCCTDLINKEINFLKIDKFIDKKIINISGPLSAEKVIENFIDLNFNNYEEISGNPEYIESSTISRFLHYGQIAPTQIISKLNKNISIEHPFLEQLLIRRELAYNFTFYNDNYNNHKSLPNWALDTLDRHLKDKREYIYELDDFEFAQTHDKYWNAAQIQLLTTGYIHGYMRMYWGKKILEWTPGYKDGIEIALYLNNKYQLDGRNPNSYVGILWCFGLHDRAWRERSIYGKIRYMNDNGLRRKFDIERYVNFFNQRDLF